MLGSPRLVHPGSGTQREVFRQNALGHACRGSWTPMEHVARIRVEGAHWDAGGVGRLSRRHHLGHGGFGIRLPMWHCQGDGRDAQLAQAQGLHRLCLQLGPGSSIRQGRVAARSDSLDGLHRRRVELHYMWECAWEDRNARARFTPVTGQCRAVACPLD